jgi:hypothetical protein
VVEYITKGPSTHRDRPVSLITVGGVMAGLEVITQQSPAAMI